MAHKQFTHAWGRSRLLHSEPATALYAFSGTKGGASSLHLHERKANVFILEDGILEIDVDGMKRRLYANQAMVVPAGVPHRMTFVDDASGYELYYPTGSSDAVVDHDDIVRLEPGWTPDGQEHREWKA
jgi:quercetin dioxygenase-like cupin family protein